MNFFRKITNVDIIEDLQRELEKERKAYQIMHNDFEMANLEVAKYKSRASELGKELIDLQEKHKEVANKLDIQTSYNERLSEENATLSQELLKMRTDFENEIRKGETKYEKIIDEYHNRCVNAEGKNKSLNDGLDYWIKKTKQLEVVTNSAQERWKAEKAQFEQQRIDLKCHNDDLKKKIERLDIQLKLKHEALVESEAERVNLRKWNQQAKELNQSLEYNNDVLLKAEKRFESENEYLKEDVQDLKAEIAELKEQLEAFKIDAIEWEEIAKTRGDRKSVV